MRHSLTTRISAFAIIIATLACVAFSSSASADWQSDLDPLLKKYVKPTGVDYKSWKASKTDMATLDSIVSAIGSDPLPAAKSDARLAHLINSYNALIINRILDDYPTKGVGSNGVARKLFFGGNKLKVAGDKTSFNDLENDLIRKNFDEPRIHFAINCASTSCPPLKASSYRAATLDKDLEAMTRAFLTKNDHGIKIEDGKPHVSEIFKWFKEDFDKAGGVAKFIGKYRDLKGASIEFQDYDWSLNEAKR